MLNPSSADEKVLDPTCAAMINRAKRWGYGRLDVLNCFALRSTDPEGLKLVDDPVGPENDKIIRDTIKDAHFILCAWGNHAAQWGRSTEVVRMIEKAGKRMFAMKFNDNGEPCHPRGQPIACNPIPMLNHPGLLQMDIEGQSVQKHPHKRDKLKIT